MVLAIKTAGGGDSGLRTVCYVGLVPLSVETTRSSSHCCNLVLSSDISAHSFRYRQSRASGSCLALDDTAKHLSLTMFAA